MTIVNYISKDLIDANKSFWEFVNDGERLLLLAIEEMNKKPIDAGSRTHRTNI